MSRADHAEIFSPIHLRSWLTREQPSIIGAFTTMVMDSIPALMTERMGSCVSAFLKIMPLSILSR
jgi:hypothetical protein